MGKIAWKPGTMLYPLPAVLISSGTMEHPNVMTAAWTGIVCTNPAMTYVSIRPERYTFELIESTGQFAINLTTEDLAWAADFCGVRSGRSLDKFAETRLTPSQALEINAPLVAESPVNLECRVERKIPLGSHVMFLSRIVSLDVDETLIDENGVFHLEWAGLIVYSHGSYYGLGPRLGTFGWTVRKHSSPGKGENHFHRQAKKYKQPQR